MTVLFHSVWEKIVRGLVLFNKNYNLKPLVVSFDHGFFRPNLKENVKKLSRNLGFDMITFTPNWKVVQKLMLQSLLEKGDFCWHCHTGIFSYPMRVSVEKNTTSFLG